MDWVRMKKATYTWVIVLCLMIVFSGLFHITLLKFGAQPLANSEDFRNEDELDIINIDEKQTSDYLLTAENETHYKNLSIIKNWYFASYTNIFDFAVVGNVTFLATGNGLVIYNTTNPAQPKLISQSFSYERFYKIIIENDLAYLRSAYGPHLTILNCSNLYNPEIINEILFNDIQDFVIENKIAYITTSYVFYGLQIYNLSDPLNPSRISDYYFEDSIICYRIVKNDGYVFCLSPNEALLIFDVSDIQNPLLIVTHDITDFFAELLVKNNFLYLLGYNIFQIWDITNIYQHLVCDTIILVGLTSFSIHNNIAYIVNERDSEFLLYNVTNPYNIHLIASYASLLPQRYLYRSRIHIEGTIASITFEQASITFLNISDYSNVTRISIEFSGYIGGIYLVEDYAILKYDSHGIKILNISDIQNPWVITYLFIEGLYGNLCYENNLIYFYSSFTNRLLIFNLTDPTSPKKISHFETSGGIDKLIVRNGLAILERYSDFLIVNVSDPLNPSLLYDSFTYYYYLRGIVLYNNYLVAASGGYPNYYFRIVNITNPSSPVTITQVNFTRRPRSINLNGSYLFVHYYYPTEFEIYDLKNITNPVLISQFGLQPYLYQFIIRDNLLYLLNRDNGLEIREIDAQYNQTLFGVLSPTNYDFWDLAPESAINDDFCFLVLDTNVLVVGFDSDDDTIADYLEINEYGTDPNDSDSDDDLMSDGYEIDFDLDPLNATDALLDYDNDSLTNYDESLILTNPWLNDTDADFLTDDLEVFYGTNPLSPDTDFDGLTDFEEIFDYTTDPNECDSDGDSLDDGVEVHLHQTDPLDNDTDDDLITDGFEVIFGLDPLFDDASFDLDLDGLTNYEEFLLGTRPNRSDSDADGYSDLEEVEAGTDPTDSDDYPDYPNHTIPTEPLSWSGVFVTIFIVFSVSVFWMRKRYTISRRRKNS